MSWHKPFVVEVSGSHMHHLDFVPLKWHDLACLLQGIVGTNFVPLSGLLYPIEPEMTIKSIVCVHYCNIFVIANAISYLNF